MNTARYNERHQFVGHEPNHECEHRTLGPFRAWCHTCGEYCYPEVPCARCDWLIQDDRHERDWLMLAFWALALTFCILVVIFSR